MTLNIVWLLTVGCSQPDSAVVTSPPAAKAKIPILDLKFEAQAGRLDDNQTVVELRDITGQGAKVAHVRGVFIDKITDGEGKPLDARLRSFRWRKRVVDSGTATSPSEIFELLLILGGSVSDPIGTLNGTFETKWGTASTLLVPIDKLETELASNPGLQAAAVTAKVEKVEQQFTVELSGPDGHLLDAQFVDGEMVLPQPKPIIKTQGPNIGITVSITDPPATAMLQVKVTQDVQTNSQEFRLQNVKLEQ